MTRTIDRDTRRRAMIQPGSEPVSPKPRTLMTGVRAFTITTALAGVGLGVADLAGDGNVHLVAPAMTAFILAGLGAVVLVLDNMLADRQEFYRRGQLAGWMNGWRGQPPDVDDPLLTR